MKSLSILNWRCQMGIWKIDKSIGESRFAQVLVALIVGVITFKILKAA